MPVASRTDKTTVGGCFVFVLCCCFSGMGIGVIVKDCAYSRSGTAVQGFCFVFSGELITCCEGLCARYDWWNCAAY